MCPTSNRHVSRKCSPKKVNTGRRSLMLQKAHAEGLRALYMYTSALLDADVAAHSFDLDAETAARVNDFLLAVVKGVGWSGPTRC